MILEKFVVFEGIDGAGTSTQMRLLAERDSGKKIVFTAEPTERPTGKFLRQILSGKEKVSAQTAAYLFAADRAEHLWGDGGIVDQTKNGLTVVSDRYLFSNLAYQGVTCGEDLPKMLNSPFPLPQLLFFFDISAQKSLERVEKRGEAKEIYENEKFLSDTASRYRSIIDQYKKLADSGMKIVELDASLPKEKISDLIWKEILPIINS
ncbi:MAG: dTMP kinase [Treponema sp.]|nr:dTMP kinase [Treponema sp.]